MRKPLFLLAIGIYCLSFISSVNAENLTIATIIKKMRASVDPTGKLNKVNTRIVEGVVTMPEQKIYANVITKYKLPNKFLITTTFQDGTKEIQAFDGQIAWKSAKGQTVKLNGPEFNYFKFSALMECFRDNWNEIFSSFELSHKLYGIKGVECYRLACIPKKEFNIDDPIIIYLDNKLFLIRKMVITEYSAIGKLKEHIYSGDYKKMNGILVSTKTETSVFGGKVVLTINKITLGKDISDSEFAFPSKK